MRQRSVRSDALPETFAYEDTGCRVHSRCLTCPLVQCVYEADHVRREALPARNARIVEMFAAGMSMVEIGKHFGVSRQAVYTVLKRREKLMGVYRHEHTQTA